MVVTDATSLNTWTFSGLSFKCSHNGTACSERPHTAKAQPKAQTPYLCCTNLYRVPTLLLFKQEDRDPFLMTITECNTLIACPWTGRHPAHHIPLVTRIPSALTAPAPTSRGVLTSPQPDPRCHPCCQPDAAKQHVYPSSSCFNHVFTQRCHWQVAVEDSTKNVLLCKQRALGAAGESQSNCPWTGKHISFVCVTSKTIMEWNNAHAFSFPAPPPQSRSELRTLYNNTTSAKIRLQLFHS